MARTIVVSEFAHKLDHALRVGSNIHMETIDQFLTPVRECLEGLKLEGADCWCVHFGSDFHTPECQAAKAVYDSLSLQPSGVNRQ